MEKFLSKYLAATIVVCLLLWYKEYVAGIVYALAYISFKNVSWRSDKINKEYTDWLEEERDKWHKKYLDEKYHKPKQKEENILFGKN